MVFKNFAWHIFYCTGKWPLEAEAIKKSKLALLLKTKAELKAQFEVIFNETEFLFLTVFNDQLHVFLGTIFITSVCFLPPVYYRSAA